MKKFIIAIAIVTTGLASSCSKNESVILAKAKTTIGADKSDVGVGD